MFLLNTILFFWLYFQAVATLNINENDWAVLKLFLITAGCNNSFCKSLFTNQSCVLPMVFCDPTTGNVIKLQLDNYNLSGSLISEIAQLTSLQSLVLSNNDFNSTIPSQLAQLSQLTFLDLSNNQFLGTIPITFDQSNFNTIRLQGNRLFGVVPFFPRASFCILQTNETGNDFCCARDKELQPCCATESDCLCSNQSTCPNVAPIPNRCFLDSSDTTVPDHALCMTENSYWRFGEVNSYLFDNFTIAFWAKARHPLGSYLGSNKPNDVQQRGLLFHADAAVDQSSVAVGFHLGTDGFDIAWHIANVSWISSVEKRLSLIGWHHYTIVAENRKSFVYIDGSATPTNNDSDVATKPLSFNLLLGTGRTRLQWSGSIVTSFEGWLSELRLANRSMMNGLEAISQINNQSAWQFSYSMRGCSGENHDGTEIDRFSLQQSWLVCKSKSLPTCGVNTPELQPWEQAGCKCEKNDGSQSCIAGYISPDDDDVIFASKPLAYWRLFDVKSDIAPDSSGNGFVGKFNGVRGVDYQVTSRERFVSFKNNSSIDFGDNNAFDFGTRNFAVEFRVRAELSNKSEAILTKLGGNCANANFWAVYLEVDGRVGFSVDEDATGKNFILIRTTLTIRDNRWHRVLAFRNGTRLHIFVDGILRSTGSGIGVANLINDNSVTIGAQQCSQFPYFLSVDLAEVAVYVDIVNPPHRLCDITGKWSYLTNSSTCNRVSGFCSPAKGDSQCCAVDGCLECPFYRSCNRNVSAETTRSVITNTPTSSTTTMIGSQSNFTVKSTTRSTLFPTTTTTEAIAINASTNSPAIIVGGVIGGLAFLVAIIAIVIYLLRQSNASTKHKLDRNESPMQTPAQSQYGKVNFDDASYGETTLASNI